MTNESNALMVSLLPSMPKILGITTHFPETYIINTKTSFFAANLRVFHDTPSIWDPLYGYQWNLLLFFIS